MAKYRKKPVVIEAQQWFPPGDGRHDPAMLCDCKGKTIKVGDLYVAFKTMGPVVYRISTLEGDLQVSSGDWIITGVKGEKYPCKPDIFAETYEPVTP